MRYILIVILLGCSENPDPFHSEPERDERFPWFSLSDTETGSRASTELEDTETGSRASTELEDTETGSRASTELEDTEELATELEDTEELATELEDTEELATELEDTEELATELEDTDTCVSICPPMVITLPDKGAYHTECVGCDKCNFEECYGSVVQTCDEILAWSPDSMPPEMEREGCSYVRCCD